MKNIEKFMEMLNEDTVKLVTSKYSWGKLIVIEVGNRFYIVIHPEN